jgi:transposase
MAIDEQGDGVGRRRVDPKAEALAKSRTLNPHPEAVTDEQFGSSAFFDARDLVQVKYEMVRQVRVQGAPVARAASAFGLSRPSYYQAAAALERSGLPGLVPAKPGPRGAHKLTDQVCQFAEQLLAADASLRPAGLVEPLAERFGLRVHPRSIERALARRREARKAGELPERKSPRGQRGRRHRGAG